MFPEFPLLTALLRELLTLGGIVLITHLLIRLIWRTMAFLIRLPGKMAERRAIRKLRRKLYPELFELPSWLRPR